VIQPATATHTVTRPQPATALLTDILLAQMRRTAASELTTHACSADRCAVYGDRWPCARARQADLALAGW